jgi:hypothetical protein
MRILKISAYVKNPAGFCINGMDDENGELTPCLFNRTKEIRARIKEWPQEAADIFHHIMYELRWEPSIEVDTGRIMNWKPGVTASIHLYVVDRCFVHLHDYDNDRHWATDGEWYVPEFLYPKKNGYGDFINMDIDGNGYIKDWKPELVDQWLTADPKECNYKIVELKIANR